MLQIKYSKETLHINLSKDVDHLLKPLNLAPLTKDELFKVLNDEPIYSDGLENVIKQSNRALIILPDITRKSGAEFFLKEITEIFEKFNKDFSIIFATGTHRKLSVDEMKSILTKELYEKYKNCIIIHDPDDIDSHVYFGKTRTNTPILINRAYMEHDTIIPIASVSYHYFAGFGGGKKMIVPGIAARKTAMSNHKLVLDETNKKKNEYAKTGNLKNNPVSDDLVSCVMLARGGKTFFLINTILNDEDKVVYVSGGDLFMSHIAATEKLKELTSIKVSKTYDAAIVSCGGFPKDINLIQAQKSLDRACTIVKKGGKIFFFAKCEDGYGNRDFEEFFRHKSSKEMFDILLTDYQINRQTAYNLKSILEKYDVYLYSNFDKLNTERIGFKKLEDVNDINLLISDCSSVAYVPNAYSVYFENCQ